MSEETKTLIKRIFIIVWALSVCLFVYRLAVRPVTINLDLSFIFKLLPDEVTQSSGNNFTPKWLYKS
jgi:hypothetical protein